MVYSGKQRPCRGALFRFFAPGLMDARWSTHSGVRLVGAVVHLLRSFALASMRGIGSLLGGQPVGLSISSRAAELSWCEAADLHSQTLPLNLECHMLSQLIPLIVLLCSSGAIAWALYVCE